MGYGPNDLAASRGWTPEEQQRFAQMTGLGGDQAIAPVAPMDLATPEAPLAPVDQGNLLAIGPNQAHMGGGVMDTTGRPFVPGMGMDLSGADPSALFPKAPPVVRFSAQQNAGGGPLAHEGKAIGNLVTNTDTATPTGGHPKLDDSAVKNAQEAQARLAARSGAGPAPARPGGGMSLKGAQAIHDKSTGEAFIPKAYKDREKQTREDVAQGALGEAQTGIESSDRMAGLMQAQADALSDESRAIVAHREGQKAAETSELGTLHQAINEASRTPPPPSESQRVGAMVAILGSGLKDFASALLGQATNHSAAMMKMMQDQVNADADAWTKRKSAKADGARSSYALLRQQGLDDDQARSAAFAVKSQEFDKQLGERAMTAQTDAQRANLESMRAQINEANARQLMQTAQTRGAGAYNLMMRANAAAAAPVGIKGKDLQERFVGTGRTPDGQGGYLAPTKEEAIADRGAQQKAKGLTGAFEDYNHASKKVGFLDKLASRVPLVGFDTSAMKHAKGAQNRAMFAVKDTEKLGAVSGGDREMGESVIGDPTEFFGQDGADEARTQYAHGIENQITQAQQTQSRNGLVEVFDSQGNAHFIPAARLPGYNGVMPWRPGQGK